MPTPFLSSEEYDERAHVLYNEGDYEGALLTLKEGLSLYPHAVELHVGLAYTRLAREEYVWAKQTLETALALDPGHEEALVGLGEVLLRFGRSEEALDLFRRVRETISAEDPELLLTMGRALYRENLLEHARDMFEEAVAQHPESAECAAALGYTLHRIGYPVRGRRQVEKALQLDPELHEARVYLGNLLYDRKHWEEALREWEQVPAAEHWDSVTLWRILEVKRALLGAESGDPRLADWEERLEELEGAPDPVDDLLAELEMGMLELDGMEGESERTP